MYTILASFYTSIAGIFSVKPASQTDSQRQVLASKLYWPLSPSDRGQLINKKSINITAISRHALTSLGLAYLHLPGPARRMDYPAS
jgi:hypothetical protein